MGLFDLPAPLFSAIDDVMGLALPAVVRLMIWALILAVGTMLLYKVLSPQARIGTAKREARAARKRLNEFDGEFGDAGPLIKDQFVTAFRHIGLVVPGTIIAILPLLCFLFWADNNFDATLPPAGQAPAIHAHPASNGSADMAWHADTRPPELSLARGGHDNTYAMTRPISVITKKSGWNYLVGNPLGYLPDDSPIDAITIDLPERQFIPFGPAWMRGWLGVFIPVMFIISLLMFKWCKIE